MAIPVSADVESGFGRTPDEVADTCRAVLETGAIGVNLEDASGDYAAAVPLYEDALRVRRKMLPPGDSSIASNEAYLGRALFRAGRAEEGRAMLRTALPAWLGFFKADDNAPEYLAAKLVQAEWLLEEGRLDEAEAALPKVMDESPAAAIKCKALAAELAQRRGDMPMAISRWSDAIKMSSAHVGADSAPTARWRLSYANALLAAGRARAAGEQLSRAEPVLRKALASESDLLRQLDRLKSDLARTGNVDGGFASRGEGN